MVVREPATEAEKKEVEAWKAARRNNYPTSANVAKKVGRWGRGVLWTFRAGAYYGQFY